MRLPDFCARFMGEHRGVRKRCVAQWNEWKDVERADARMLAAMCAEIDAFGGSAGQGDRRRKYGSARADCGDDAAIMHGIAGAMDDARARAADRPGARINHRGITAIGDVRNDLEKWVSQTRA